MNTIVTCLSQDREHVAADRLEAEVTTHSPRHREPTGEGRRADPRVLLAVDEAATLRDKDRMEVPLPPDLEEFLRHMVMSGKYSSQADAVREGVRLLMARDGQAEPQGPRTHREMIDAGLAQAEGGQLVDGPATFERLQRRIRSRDQQTP